MTTALTNSQVFLNEPTIEAARDKYLTRWHLVSKHWGGKKPTLAQFKKRFGKDYEKRQNWLKKQGVDVSLAEQHSTEQSREVLEAGLVAILEQIRGGVAVAEPEVENLGSEDDEDDEDENGAFLSTDEEESGDTQISRLLAILTQQKAPAKAEKVEPEQKFVKPENFDELPRSGQVYFFLHRAQEAGLSYAIVPIKRGVAAEAISQIKDDGRSYKSVASDLVKSK